MKAGNCQLLHALKTYVRSVPCKHKYGRKLRFGGNIMWPQEMEDDSIGHKEEAAVISGDGKTVKRSSSGGDFNRCFSLPIDAGGVKSLKHLDSKKLKEDIKKWAKKVVAYARQLSDHFNSGVSSRRS